jgi:hypothetical protein
MEGYTMTPETTRRALLAGAAVVPLVCIPALAAAAPDPIFAAIEEVRAIHAEWAAHGRKEPSFDHHDTPAWSAKNDELGGEYCDAIAAMFDLTPTTLAGAAALCVLVPSIKPAMASVGWTTATGWTPCAYWQKLCRS